MEDACITAMPSQASKDSYYVKGELNLKAIRNYNWGFYGNWILPLCGVTAFASYGSVLYTWPVFFPVVLKEFGWSAAVAATASSLARFEGGFEGPLVGWILDKYGPRVVMLTGGILTGLGLIALGFMNDILYYYIFFGVVVNISYNSSNYTASYKAVALWWVRWRARAISIMILPTAIAGTFGPTVGVWAIGQFGWRTAVMMMGALVVILYIAAASFIRPHRPEYYGLLPDGDDPKKVAAAAAASEKASEVKNAEQALAQETMKKEVDWTTRDAVRSRVFWIYAFATIFSSFAGGVVTLFVPSQLMSRGYTAMEAAFYAGLMMSITYVGRFTVMIIADIIGPKWMLVIAWILQGLGCASLANATLDTTYFAMGYAIFYGVGYGMSIPLSAAVRGWLFGRTSFAQISGWIATIGMAGSVTAPTFAGWVFDVNGTYYLSYMASFLTFSCAAFVLVFAKKQVAKVAETLAPGAA